MSWAPHETGVFARTFEECFGNQPAMVVETYRRTLEAWPCGAVVEALKEIMLRQERRGRPTLETILASLESAGHKLQRHSCQVCLGVQCVPVDLVVSDRDAEGLDAIPRSQKLLLTRKRADGLVEQFWALDVAQAGNVRPVTEHRAAIWCGECCPDSVAEIFRGPVAAKRLLGKFYVPSGHAHLERDLSRILSARKIDFRYVDQRKYAPQEIAADDEFWAERLERAETPKQREALVKFREIMRRGQIPMGAEVIQI